MILASRTFPPDHPTTRLVELQVDAGERQTQIRRQPAFSYYESQTGQPISRAVADYLIGN